MRFFLDTADTSIIERWADTGLIAGITTNPTLIAKSGKPIKDVLKTICNLVDGPISAEVTAENFEGMMQEADKLLSIADNIIIKVPLTVDGLKACHYLSSREVHVNVTLCFTPQQALLAAQVGAAYISPFVGRLEDRGENGLQLIQDIRDCYDQGLHATEILAASIRTSAHVFECAKRGADVATIPPKILEELVHHPLTDAGLELFQEDWKKTGQSIL